MGEPPISSGLTAHGLQEGGHRLKKGGQGQDPEDSKEHSTLSVSLGLKSKPSTVDCTLWLTVSHAAGLGIRRRQEARAGHPGRPPPGTETVS